jgi:DNA-binding transcriptional regulator GbsR (MarR family)
MWSMSGQENDEISKILNDEKAEDKLQELLTYLSETRIAKIFTKMVEEFDISEFELNFETPQEILDMFRNQEHPTMKKIVSKIQGLIQDKLQKGAFTQQQLINEIEDIKRKIQGLFGNMFNEMLGGTRSEIPVEYLRGGSPEARRARMLYRMQKQRLEKNSRKK